MWILSASSRKTSKEFVKFFWEVASCVQLPFILPAYEGKFFKEETMENIIEYSGKHRLFHNPEATKLSFQLDQNAEEKVFLFPRYLDGFDLSEFTCYLLLSGAGWTDRVELAQETCNDETISYSWTVSALATSTGKPVIFQPVFYKEPVILHLDKDIFTISSSVDTDSEIGTYYPDYISG
jgi:hypothetical protein